MRRFKQVDVKREASERPVGSVVPLLDVQALTVAYDTGLGPECVVCGLSFSIDEASTTALVGVSGAGKTQTALAIMGLLDVEAQVNGKVLYRGNDLLRLKNEEYLALRGGQIAMVFQDPASALDPLFRVERQIIETVKANLALGKDKTRQRAGEAIEAVGLTLKQARRYPHELSGGQRQKAALARAIAVQPKLLIVDELTTAQDARAKAEILKLLIRLKEELGLTLLYISHDFYSVDSVAGRVVVIDRGRKVEQGSSHEVIHRPKSTYTRSLVAPLPVLKGPARRVKAKDALLAAEGITVSYPRRGPLGLSNGTPKVVLDNVSIYLSDGETLGLVGPTGAGKSTLARVLLGLERTTSGEVIYHGSRLAECISTFRRDVQTVFQDPTGSLNPRMTVTQLITDPLEVQGEQQAAQIKGKVESMLEQVGLHTGFLDRYPHELSGGQAQRVAIARALVIGPKVLILDEPVTNLDRPVKAQVLELLAEMKEQQGLSYLVISHDEEVVGAVCERVVEIRDGRIVGG